MTDNHRNFLFYHYGLLFNKKTTTNPIHIVLHKKQENTKSNQSDQPGYISTGKYHPPGIVKISGYTYFTSTSYIRNGQTIRL